VLQRELASSITGDDPDPTYYAARPGWTSGFGKVARERFSARQRARSHQPRALWSSRAGVLFPSTPTI